MSLKNPESIETKLARAVVTGALGAGYWITVHDEEGPTATQECTDQDQIFEELAETDFNEIQLGGMSGHKFITFIWGLGDEVVSDHSVGLEDELAIWTAGVY